MEGLTPSGVKKCLGNVFPLLNTASRRRLPLLRFKFATLI